MKNEKNKIALKPKSKKNIILQNQKKKKIKKSKKSKIVHQEGKKKPKNQKLRFVLNF